MKKKIVIAAICVLSVLAITAGAAGLYINKLKNPKKLFEEESSPTPTPKPTANLIIERSEAPVATPEPTVDPYEALMEEADYSMMKDIVNVLVIGVDYAEERETWNGKHAYHSDVMMVLAINFEDNRVDMISLPRDTYANIPGVKGIYKLNASIDCGGGFPKPEAFGKVCEAAEWMLGGIPVDYYYAVTMPAVKELGNIVGGVDYDMDIDFTIAGRSYKKGMQHLDGQGILDYLRVRKNIGSAGGDSNRVNRQKKMLVAIYEKMKKENMLVKIPELLSAFEGQLYTNTTFNQTASLALFAMGLDSENIAMHSMVGTTTSIFGWNFCLTNQKKRVELIKEVYNASVPVYDEYTPEYAHYRWNDMLAEFYLENKKSTPYKRYNEIKEIMEADKKLPEVVVPTPTPTASSSASASPGVTGTPSPTPKNTSSSDPDPTPSPSPSPSPTPSPSRWLPIPSFSFHRGYTTLAGEGTYVRRYSKEVHELYDALVLAHEELEDARNEQLRVKKAKNKKGERLIAAVENYHLLMGQMSKALGLKAITDNQWEYRYWDDPTFNEVMVDFR